MSVTISGTSVTYNDGSVQTTRPTLLGALQYSAYTQFSVLGQAAYTTTLVNQSIGGTTNLDPSTIVICGYQSYRSGAGAPSIDTTADSRGDFLSGIIQVRAAYRSVGSA